MFARFLTSRCKHQFYTDMKVTRQVNANEG